jgi:hypothetical protein
VDISKAEQVEKELAISLTKADKKRRKQEGERPPEPSYMANLRDADAARQRENAWRWLQHHTRQLRNRERTTALLDAADRQEIRKYERILGLDHEGDDAA